MSVCVCVCECVSVCVCECVCSEVSSCRFVQSIMSDSLHFRHG